MSTPPTHLARQRLGDDLRQILEARGAAQDAALEEMERHLRALAKTIGTRLEAALGGAPLGPPESWTDFEKGLVDLTDSAQVRAQVLATELDDLADFIGAAGLDTAREDWFRRYQGLADLAEEHLGLQGVREADRILDQEAARAAIGALVNRHDAVLWGGQELLSAARLMDGLHSQVGLVSHKELAQRIALAEGDSIPQALTQARTRMAEADRAFQEEAATAADPEGQHLLRVYTGELDDITRPFCRQLVGVALSVEEVRGLSNAQTPTHPIHSGGGYNCRHKWVAVAEDRLKDLGYRRGGPSDVAAANAAAIKGRRRKKGGKKRRSKGKRK